MLQRHVAHTASERAISNSGLITTSSTHVVEVDVPGILLFCTVFFTVICATCHTHAMKRGGGVRSVSASIAMSRLLFPILTNKQQQVAHRLNWFLPFAVLFHLRHPFCPLAHTTDFFGLSSSAELPCTEAHTTAVLSSAGIGSIVIQSVILHFILVYLAKMTCPDALLHRDATLPLHPLFQVDE